MSPEKKQSHWVQPTTVETQKAAELLEEREKRRLADEATEMRMAMSKDLRTWGIALIILGVIHIVAAGILDPVWGGVIIVLGIVNLIVRHRGMFIANGIALVCVGVMNIVGSIAEASYFWIGLGALQLWWGASEIRKFVKYAPLYHTKTSS